MTERVLTVNFLGNTAGLEAALKRTSEKLNGFQAAGARMQSVGKSMTRNLTVPIIGFGVAAAAASVKFQRSMEQLHTQAGVGQKAVGQLSKGILDMAGSVGTSPEKLADGMYHVASSLNATLAPAKRTSTELNVLRIAAEGAQVGHANLVDVTNALDAAVVSGIKGVQNYSQAMGALNSIVGAGDMTMQDLADALSTGLLAPMKTYGLTLKDVGGALATFGDNNIRGQEAATKLISAVRIMAAPSKAAAKELGGIGLSTTQLADDMRKGGLVGALTDLRNHLKDSGLTASQQGLVISRAFGGRQSTGVQVLLHQLDRLKAKTDEVGKGAQGFGDAWAAFQKTAAFQIHKGLASMQADLVRFGNDVLPSLLKIGGQVIKGVDTVAHAFTSLPKGAQDAIIKGGLVLAAIGPAMKLLGVFTGGIGHLWDVAKKIQAWGAIKTATGGTPLSTAAAGKQLTSSVGTMEVGTLIARSTIAPIAGGAGATLGKTAAKDAAATAGADVAKVETGIASGGLLANIKSGIGKIAGGALKGVAIAGIGTLMSQTIGEAIHGSVGKAIKTIGTDASLGAGMGAFFGPEGIAGGAILGGLYGVFRTFLKNPSHGEKIASQIFSGGFGGKQAPTLAKQTAAALDALGKFETGSQFRAVGRGGVQRVNVQLDFSKLSPKNQAQALAAANKAGMLVAKQLEAGWNQYRFPDEPTMFRQFRGKFARLPKEAQAKGADLAIKFAAGLEHAGRLPQGATDDMIRSIEQRFPDMWRYIGLSARDGVMQFAKAMDLSRADQNVKTHLHKVSQDFQKIQYAMDATNGSIGAKSAAAVAALKRLAQGTGSSAALARRDLHQLRGTVNTDLSAAVALMNSKAKAMGAAIRRGVPGAVDAVVSDFDRLKDKIGSAMAAGTISVQRASTLIGRALNAMLKTENAALSPKSLAQWEKFWRMGAVGGRDTQALGHRNERGGMFQFGRAGDRGKDMIPVNFGGRQIVVGSGEVGLVLTGDQQAVLNERTADMGGLPGMIAKHDRPHSQSRRGFQTGGMVWGVDPGTHQKVKHTQEEWKRIWTALRRALSAHDRATSRERSSSGGSPIVRRERPSSSGGVPFGHRGGGGGGSSSGGPFSWGIDPRTHQQARHSKSDWGKVWENYRADFAAIPSQSTTAQIRMTLLANQQQIAQNRGDTAGEQKALAAEAKLGQHWLTLDQKRLEEVKRKLHDPSISRGFRSGLLADELALLQESGSVQANIGTATSTAGGGGGSGSSGQFDLMPGSIKLPTVYDVHGAIAAGIAQQPHYRDHVPRLKAMHRQPQTISYRDREGRERHSIVHRDRHHETGRGVEPASHTHTHHHANRINVHVHNKRDVDDVADAIDRATGSRLHAQLRAQGLRGT